MKRLGYRTAAGRIVATALMAFLGAIAVPEGRTWRIAVVTDTEQEFAMGLRRGFMGTMDTLLAENGDRAEYAVYDTGLSAAKAAAIVDALRATRPDLIFDINFPTAFADLNVAMRLADPAFRFVSENAIPVQSGVAESWDRPGGNVTGVSVFVRFNSQLRLMRMIRPEARKLVVFSWDAMTLLNDWYLREVRRACAEEGFELVATGLVPGVEAEFAFLAPFADAGPEYVVTGIVSPQVHDDGRPADVWRLEPDFMNRRMRIPLVCYDENPMRAYALAGACAIWGDIGAQAAEKGIRILEGENPGELPWEYPRSYNIILNLAVARRLGVAIPQPLINAAYRVYTDFDGGYAGGAR